MKFLRAIFVVCKCKNLDCLRIIVHKLVRITLSDLQLFHCKGHITTLKTRVIPFSNLLLLTNSAVFYDSQNKETLCLSIIVFARRWGRHLYVT
jgi:hypothetical protein